MKRRKGTWAEEAGGIGGEMIFGSEVTSLLRRELRNVGQRVGRGRVVCCVAGDEHVTVKICEWGQCHGAAIHVESDLGHRPKRQTEWIQIFLRILVSFMLNEESIASCDSPS